jgi:hypothetical protein
MIFPLKNWTNHSFLYKVFYRNFDNKIEYYYSRRIGEEDPANYFSDRDGYFIMDLKSRQIVYENNSILLLLEIMNTEKPRERFYATRADLHEDYFYHNEFEDRY